VLRRVGYALAGLRWAWAHEASLRAEVFALALASLLMLWRNPDLLWWVAWIAAALLLLAAELGNSAIERLADHLHPAHHPAIGQTKDMAAAFVFMTGVAAAATLLGAIASTL